MVVFKEEKANVSLHFQLIILRWKFLKKTLCGGFSSVNTRLSFDTKKLMPNLTERHYHNMNIDQSFKAFKRDDLKLVFVEA